MSPERIYLDYIRDMLENAEKTLKFVAGMSFDEFAKMTRHTMQLCEQ
jgi:uncharacterized protein with HEPN domain